MGVLYYHCLGMRAEGKAVADVMASAFIQRHYSRYIVDDIL